MKFKYFITLLLLWSLGPLIWQLYTSFSTTDSLLNPLDINHFRWTFQNYSQIINIKPTFWRYLLNSTILGLFTTFLTLLISVPASYTISKLKRKYTNIIKLFLLILALFPYVILFLALLELARNLHLSNNLLLLSIPYTALCLPLALLLLSSAFNDLPTDLEDASKLEGLNLFQRLRFVLIPILAPATGSTAILIFLFSWNEYPIALTWISRDELITLPVAIARIAGSSIYSVPYGAYAAATVLGSIPLLLIVLIFQKQIVSGLTQGAVKG